MKSAVSTELWACGPSAAAGIAGVANYSTGHFIAIFPIGPGFFPWFSGYSFYTALPPPVQLSIKLNRFIVVKEQESERHWQAK